MRIVMLKIWQELYELSSVLFAPEVTGPFCQRGKCEEGKMACGKPMEKGMKPVDILQTDFSALMEGGCHAD